MCRNSLIKHSQLDKALYQFGDRVFESCSSLEILNIPSLVTSIGNYSFSLCSEFETVTNGDGVETISWQGCLPCGLA